MIEESHQTTTSLNCYEQPTTKSFQPMSSATPGPHIISFYYFSALNAVNKISPAVLRHISSNYPPKIRSHDKQQLWGHSSLNRVLSQQGGWRGRKWRRESSSLQLQTEAPHQAAINMSSVFSHSELRQTSCCLHAVIGCTRSTATEPQCSSKLGLQRRHRSVSRPAADIDSSFRIKGGGKQTARFYTVAATVDSVGYNGHVKQWHQGI